MIADPPGERDDFIVEHDGRAIGKAGCWRLPEIGFILHPDYLGPRIGPGGACPRSFRICSSAFPFPRSPPTSIPATLPAWRCSKGLGFEETGRAARTWLIGETWCDSIYLALPRPGPG